MSHIPGSYLTHSLDDLDNPNTSLKSLRYELFRLRLQSSYLRHVQLGSEFYSLDCRGGYSVNARRACVGFSRKPFVCLQTYLGQAYPPRAGPTLLRGMDFGRGRVKFWKQEDLLQIYHVTQDSPVPGSDRSDLSCVINKMQED